MPRKISRFGAALAGSLGAGQGTLLGAWTSAEESALNEILKTSFPKIYGSNWLEQMKPLTLADVRKIVKGAMYYYGLGYSINDYKSFFRSLQKALPEILPLNVTKVLAFISGIDAARFPADIALLKTGRASNVAKVQQAEIATKEKKEYIAQEIQDKIDRGVSAVASAGVDAVKTVSSALPWYLRPTTLIPVAAVAALGYFWFQKKGLSTILAAGRGYTKNPITKREAAKKTFEIFHDRKPRKTIALPEIDASELVHLGQALEIGYRSNKWTGKKTNYLHKFDKGVRMMCTPDRKTLVIHGGQMEIQDVGIVH